MSTPRQQRPSASKLNQLRIIGGKWRSRRLSFPDAPGLRPTGDRMRETLFNWLAPHLAGARCLDAFAGSGALGFEALSRGAREALFLESDPAAVKALRASQAQLQATDASILQTDTLNWLNQAHSQPFDIIFLDPPFAAHLQQACLERIATADLCHRGSLVYAEYPSENYPGPPPGWQVVKEKRAGNVYCLLLSLL